MKQVALFVITLFGVTWTLSFLWPPPAQPENLWVFLPHLLPSVWAPTIIALIVTAMMEGTASVRKELRARLSYRRGAARWLILAGIVPIIATAAAVFTTRAAGDSAPFISRADMLPMIGLQVVTGAVGEELGWRGFLLPRLAKRLGEIKSGWVMAILWSLWNLPAFFTPGLPHRTMPIMSTLLTIGFFGVFLAFVSIEQVSRCSPRCWLTCY